MQKKKFTRTKEDFVCENCGFNVVGDGYTNHCPECLFSKHVDINPGDRDCSCGGLMEPVALENKGDVFYIVHKCQKCDFVRNNKALKGDNFQKLVELSASHDK
jgi:rubredoxin